ncbi:hypothetical protein BCIN_14g05270 [Botrytis cinerea B05.10]|uniref:Uncharacterized protein n=1 Tax=Botryotinia fuckeliana (strain B05.10) TaxID=332648 RepID=A0A384K3P4_BOTFB|nr:hypothetical protein BCIN_14g05270 [Botrytis cinerea B05.10]ATZ57382.1 hypothetical protein BCIN_14g05270 [Botrytis cinerea B05.10]
MPPTPCDQHIFRFNNPSTHLSTPPSTHPHIMDSLPNFPQRPFAVAFMALPILYVIWLIVSMVLLWASPVIISSFAVTMAIVKAFMWGVIWILVVVYLVMKIAEVYLRLSLRRTVGVAPEVAMMIAEVCLRLSPGGNGAAGFGMVNEAMGFVDWLNVETAGFGMMNDAMGFVDWLNVETAVIAFIDWVGGNLDFM